jgi:hypothetical protein
VFFQEQLFRSSFLLIARRIFGIPLLFQMTNTCVALAHNGTYPDTTNIHGLGSPVLP